MKKILEKIGRYLKIYTSQGKPDINDAPVWAEYIGKTPEGAYHWLSNKSRLESEHSESYFPDAIKTEFTGFIGKKGKGYIRQILSNSKQA